MKTSLRLSARTLRIAALATALAGGLALASGCMFDPGSANRRVTVDNPLKPVECPKGFHWDDKTKNCVQSKPVKSE